jgi:hypothetical protein
MLLGSARRWIAVVAASLTFGLFYGGLAAVLARVIWDASEEWALLAIGLPVGMLAVLLIWKRLPKILGFDK